MWEERLALFDKLVAANPNFERKGKTMPYTSANGHMFALLNKDGELGMRLSKEEGKAFMETHNTTGFRSHGANMRGYVLIPDAVLNDFELLGQTLEAAYQYVLTLEPK